MTIPNLITVFRLLLVPVVILMILGEDWRWAFALFVIAGIADGFDGFVARQFDIASRIGAVLDPLADKVLIAAIYITLAVVGAIPAWLAVVVVRATHLSCWHSCCHGQSRGRSRKGRAR